MVKSELRKLIRQQKRACSPAERQRQSDLLCSRIVQEDWWKKAKVVLLYAPLNDELDVWGLIDAACRDAKTVLLPVVVGDPSSLQSQESILKLYVYDGKTRVGAYGIVEPVPSGYPFIDYEKIDVAIIPGMAFDSAGHRLGRGKGYYDRLLAEFGGVLKVGVCLDFQLVDAVPAESHDVTMDCVIAPY